MWRAAALITAARDSKKKRLNPTNLWRPSALVTYPSNPGNALAIRGGSPGGGFVNRGEHLGEWVGFVLFRKSRRGFRRGGRFRRLLEILKGSPGRGSLSACVRNRVIVQERGLNLGMFKESRTSFRRFGRFRNVSQEKASVQARGSILVVFFKKAAVGRAVVWTVGRMDKTWQRRCTCVSNVANVSGFKATR